jgi:hypothetical protein
MDPDSEDPDPETQSLIPPSGLMKELPPAGGAGAGADGPPAPGPAGHHGLSRLRPQAVCLHLPAPVCRLLQSRFLLAVLRIHDFLVWIRIRGSMPLTNGSGSCYFRH